MPGLRRQQRSAVSCPVGGATLTLIDDGIRQSKSGNAETQPEVPEPEVQHAAASPMHYQS
jgi:hypothetical protein